MDALSANRLAVDDSGRAPLGRLVRSEPAIAESTLNSPSNIPGAITTPTGVSAAAPANVPAPREFSTRSRAGDGPVKVPYHFALCDLNRRSYYLIDTEDQAPLPEALRAFRRHLRRAIVLANLEACVVRNAQLAGQPPGYVTLDLRNPVDPDHRNAADDAVRRAENLKALEPVESLLTRPDGMYDKRTIAGLLEEEIRAANAAIAALGSGSGAAGGGIADCGPAQLQALAYTFAAYQPAVLDEEVKGSQSPCDPRSHTRTIREVRERVEWSTREADTRAPEELAGLAMALLGAVRRHRAAAPMPHWLLQAGCMSGHHELVEKLLSSEVQGLGLYELDIIRRLRAAWVGYKYYKPLQEWRTDAQAHTMDWLDFKSSVPRAVLIAHKVVETLILRDDHGMTQSLQRPTGQQRPGSPGPPAPSPFGPVGEASTVFIEADGRGSLAADGAVAPPSPSHPHHPHHLHCHHLHDTDRPSQTPRPGTRVSSSISHELLTDDEHLELEPKKWRLVMDLFKRPAACKPLALAIMHLVLAGKRDVQKALREDRERAAEEEAERQAAAAATGGVPSTGQLPPLDGGGGAAAEDTLAAEAAALAAREEEARVTLKYRKLHLLAVQACHLAVHSTSLSAVSDAILCVRAVRAWPALDLHCLNDLAQHFPRQAAQLLEGVPLQEVDLEDNVLPFGLPAGFMTVAVSDMDAKRFREGGGSGSTQDAEHFATQTEEDASIEASLLVLARSWLSLLLLFWPAELRSPPTRKMLRVLGCAVTAFLCQGPGSCAVAAVFGALLLLVGLASRIVIAAGRIVYWSVLRRAWLLATQRFPLLLKLANRIRGVPAAGASLLGTASSRVPPDAGATPTVAQARTRSRAWESGEGASPERQGRGANRDYEGDSDSDGGGEDASWRALLPQRLGRGLWKGVVAHGHNAVVDGALGWGKASTSISCRKVPMPMSYGGKGAGAGGRQMDTALLEKLLRAGNVHPSVFGSKMLRAMILFKWNYFTKYFIILQLLLHVTYMAVFTAYAFTIKDMVPVDGREHGPGAHTPGCQLQAPSRVQMGLLVALAVMTVDFTVQEIRQIRHFGVGFFKLTWDLLDVCSVALVVASIVLHFTCSAGVSPLTLRGLAAVQIVLLFMRLLYYAMASDKLGSFVRMVLETTYDLMMFFAFLSVVFVGFALALIIAQGAIADEEQTFIKMFTMMYGDFDVDFLSNLDSGALGLDALTRVIASVYMILVTIILLNLLISIISESYERIRENERWESLRNKALLIVESETQLYQCFLTWLYTTLTPPSAGHDGSGECCVDTGKRFLYVIAPEYARRGVPADDESDEEDDEGDDDDDDDGADGQWNGRLGEMKRHISMQARTTLDAVRKEVGRVVESLEAFKAAAAAASSTAAMEGSGGDCGAGEDAAVAAAEEGAGGGLGEEVPACGPVATRAAEAAAPLPAQERASAVSLDLHTLELITDVVGARISQEISALRGELMAELARVTALPHQHPMGHGAGLKHAPSPSFSRLAPLPSSPQRQLRPSNPGGSISTAPFAAADAAPVVTAVPDIPAAASDGNQAEAH